MTCLIFNVFKNYLWKFKIGIKWVNCVNRKMTQAIVMSVVSAGSPTTLNDANSRVITAVWLRIPFVWDMTLLHWVDSIPVTKNHTIKL
jgi:hypothetical protein